MSNLVAIFENKEAFSLLLQAKRDLRHEAICLFCNLQAVWKHLPVEMQNESKAHIVQAIVEKGLLELSHSSAVLDAQIDGVLKGHGESVRAQREKILDQGREMQELSDQCDLLRQQVCTLTGERDATNIRLEIITKEMQQNADDLASVHNAATELGRTLEERNSKLSSLKQALRTFASEIKEDDKQTLFKANISRQDIVARLNALANT